VPYAWWCRSAQPSHPAKRPSDLAFSARFARKRNLQLEFDRAECEPGVLAFAFVQQVAGKQLGAGVQVRGGRRAAELTGQRT